MTFAQAINEFIPQVEAEMHRLVTPPDSQPESIDPFYGMMHYHLGWLDSNLNPAETASGKRLRPAFTLIACQTMGGAVEKAMPAAVAVELIHNFTLVHDDIQDRSDTRRGRPTVWTIWGEAQAINTGDALFVLGRNALLKLAGRGVPAQTILQAAQKLDETCLALCQGQYLDMSFETSMDVDLKAYLKMIKGKTAALLACSGYLGALVATDDQTQAQYFWNLGLAMGLAFQIQDDWLGIWGEESQTGKKAADDLRRRKKSLPVVYALNQKTASAHRFREIYAAEHMAEADVAEAITLLKNLGAETFTVEKAKAYAGEARQALAAIDADNEAKATLEEMVMFFIERNY